MPDTVPRALTRAVREVGEHDFLDLNGTRYGYAEVDRRATRFVHMLEGATSQDASFDVAGSPR